jgi:hypothetical protein
MKNIHFLSTTLLFTILLFSNCCRKNETINYPFANACCCGTGFEAGIANLFIPNIFTPNNDNLNDALSISIGNNIKYVVNVTIKDVNNNLLASIDSSYNGVDRKNWNGYSNGNVYYGLVTINCTVVDMANTSTNITATSCSLNSSVANFKTIIKPQNCIFEDQWSPGGTILVSTKEPCTKF